MKTKIIFLFFILLSYLVTPQSMQKISGRVVSENNSPLEGYSAILISPKDSTIVKYDFFLDPDFSIQTNQVPILLKISSFGYMDTLISVISSDQHLSEIKLVPQLNLLSEVVVQASTPMFNMKNGNITLNVSGTILGESGSAVDVLQKAARVKIEENGVSVLGVGNAIILIDGREIPGNQSLEMLSSSEIQKIDIITNPSSKYDAKGKAVIEIYTKKAKNYGIGAEITGRMSKGEYWSPNIGAEVSAKTSKLSFYGFYTYSQSKKYYTESYIRDYTNETSPVYELIDIESTNKTQANHRVRLSTDYNISSKHKAGLQFSGNFSDGNNAKNQLSNTYQHSDIHAYPTNKLSSVQTSPFNRRLLTGTAYYSYQPSPNGLILNTVFDKSQYNTESDAHIEEEGEKGTIMKQNNVKTNISITSLKADITIPLAKNYKLEAGIKYSNIRNNSSNFLSSQQSTIHNINYNYKENLGSLYLIISKPFGKINAELGARAEVCDNYATTNIIVQDTSQLNLFPSLNLNYNFNNNWDLNFSYAMKISRPTFQDLNPAIEYVDSLTYFQGNPKLVPEIRHALTLKISYMKMLSLGISYTKKDNLLAWYIEQDKQNPALTKVTQKNINRSDVLSIDATIPYQNRWVSCYLATGVIYTITNDKNSGVTNLKRPMWYAYSGFDFTLPYGFKFSTNVRYFTKGLENIFYYDPVFRMDAGIRKTFFNDQLTATIMWDDIFRTDAMNTYTNINNQHIGYHYYFDRSTINLSLTYRFSKQKSKYKSHSSISEESQRIKNLN